MIISFVLIVCIMIFMSQIMNRVWHKNNILNKEENHYYLLSSLDEKYDFNQTSIYAVFSFFLLSNSFIPLNMAVINFLTWYFYSLLTWADPQFIGVERSE